MTSHFLSRIQRANFSVIVSAPSPVRSNPLCGREVVQWTHKLNYTV
jgi:hypothetical protein